MQKASSSSPQRAHMNAVIQDIDTLSASSSELSNRSEVYNFVSSAPPHNPLANNVQSILNNKGSRLFMQTQSRQIETLAGLRQQPVDELTTPTPELLQEVHAAPSPITVALSSKENNSGSSAQVGLVGFRKVAAPTAKPPVIHSRLTSASSISSGSSHSAQPHAVILAPKIEDRFVPKLNGFNTTAKGFNSTVAAKQHSFHPVSVRQNTPPTHVPHSKFCSPEVKRAVKVTQPVKVVPEQILLKMSHIRVQDSATEGIKIKCFGPGLGVVNTFQTTEFFIDMKGVGPGQIGISMAGPSDAGIKMTQMPDNVCRVTYFPKEPGVYKIHVKFIDKEIAGSPFSVKCCGAGERDQAKPGSQQKRTGGGQSATVGTPINLTLSLGYDEKHRHGLTAQLLNPDGHRQHMDLTFLHDDKYRVNFTPTVVGAYQIIIRNNGVEIAGSPFAIEASPPDPEAANRVIAKGLGLTQGFVGSKNNFEINTKNAGAGSVAVDVRGPSKAEIEFGADGKVSYQVPTPGKYVVTVKYNGKDIPNSPFGVTVVQ